MFNFGPNDVAQKPQTFASMQQQQQAEQEQKQTKKKSEKDAEDISKKQLSKIISKKKSPISKFAKKIDPNAAQQTPQPVHAQEESQKSSVPSLSGASQPVISQEQQQSQPRRPSFFGNSTEKPQSANIQQQQITPQNVALNDSSNPFAPAPLKVSTNERRESNSSMNPKEKALMMFIQQMTNYQKQHESANTKIKENKKIIETSQNEINQALANENFALAEQITKKINAAKLAIAQHQHTLAQTVDDAMKLAINTPTQLIAHNEELLQALPELSQKKKELDQKLIKLVDEQQVDTVTKEQMKTETEETIATLTEPFKLRKTEFEARKATHAEKVREAEKPFREKCEELRSEKSEHEAEIKALQEEIENHRKAIREIQQKINIEERNAKEAAKAFNGELAKLQADIKQFEVESASSQRQVKEAEAKYDKICKTVERREKEIESITSDLETVDKQLSDAERDRIITEVTTQRIRDLCHSHSTFLATRETALTIADEASQKLRDVEKEKGDATAGIHTHRASIAACEETLQKTKTDLPKLEASKASAVAAKNFKSAGQYSSQIKEMENQAKEAESQIRKSKLALQKLEMEAKKFTPLIAEAQQEASDANAILAQMDFSFYEDVKKELEAVCNESPFCAKILQPLTKMINLELEILKSEKPQTRAELQEQLDQLNKEIDTASSNENYTLAAQLQEKAAILAARIENCK